MKSRYIYELRHEEWKRGKDFMLQEVAFITWNHPLRNLLFKAIADYESGKFSYDGATLYIGHKWELQQVKYYNATYSKKDVLLTVLGGFIIGIIFII